MSSQTRREFLLKLARGAAFVPPLLVTYDLAAAQGKGGGKPPGPPGQMSPTTGAATTTTTTGTFQQGVVDAPPWAREPVTGAPSMDAGPPAPWAPKPTPKKPPAG